MFRFGISRASHLLLICTGAPAFYDFLALVDLAAAVCRREGWDRILVDCISIPVTLTLEELSAVTEYAATTLAGQHVALVVPDQKRFDATLSATASAEGKLRYFTNLMDAATWLLDTPKTQG